MVNKYFAYGYKEEWKLTDEPYLSYKIHIGKCSSGWKPLFRSHKAAYKSVHEMLEFLGREKEYYRIFNEYNEEIDLIGLKEELIDWGETQVI